MLLPRPSGQASASLNLCNTYYYLAQQSDYSGPDDTALYDMNGNVIAMAPAAFVADVCVEGSGKLSDGRVINFAGSCQYGPVCPTGGQSCYVTLDSNRYPWGEGVHGRPLTPFRSIATDPNVIPPGTCIYVPSWDGLQIPAVGGLGGFTHDGHFVADDGGGWIRGSHIDIFCGTRGMWHAIERIVPTSYNGGANGSCSTTFQASVIDCSSVPAVSTSSSRWWLVGAIALVVIGAVLVAGFFLHRAGKLPASWSRRISRLRLNPRERTPKRSKLRPALIAGAVGGGLALGTLAAYATSRSGSRGRKIITVVFENKRRDAVIGSPHAPTFTALAQQYRDLPNYTSSLHPSLPNYIVMTSGSPNGITDDIGFTIQGRDNVFAQMDSAGVSWRSYAESLPGSCPTSDTDLFARRHVPALYYDSVTSNPGYCAAQVVDYSNFLSDLAGGTLPSYSFVTPNICNDAHDCSIGTADTWLSSFISAVQASPSWSDTVVFILFDETEGGGTVIPATIVSPLLSNPGTPDPTPYTHVSYLATVQDMLGLGRTATTVGASAIPL